MKQQILSAEGSILSARCVVMSCTELLPESLPRSRGRGLGSPTTSGIQKYLRIGNSLTVIRFTDITPWARQTQVFYIRKHTSFSSSASFLYPQKLENSATKNLEILEIIQVNSSQPIVLELRISCIMELQELISNFKKP